MLCWQKQLYKEGRKSLSNTYLSIAATVGTGVVPLSLSLGDNPVSVLFLMTLTQKYGTVSEIC